METNHAEPELRRYLLGELADDAAAALEWDYFAQPDLIDRVRVVESDLVDDYLTGRLSAHERHRFEQHYLVTPVHRRRLAITRELRATAARRGPRESPAWWTDAIDALRGPRRALTAAAAALVLIAVAGVWMLRSRSFGPAVEVTAPQAMTSSRESSPSGSASEQRPESPVAPESPRTGRITVALTLSPLTVRGADEAPVLTISQEAEVVVLHLEGDTVAPAFVRGRAVVRTVTGREIWQGPAAPARETPATLARVEIPAATLTPDDYIVILFETGRDGGDAERDRYFLRVRPR